MGLLKTLYVTLLFAEDGPGLRRESLYESMSVEGASLLLRTQLS